MFQYLVSCSAPLLVVRPSLCLRLCLSLQIWLGTDTIQFAVVDMQDLVMVDCMIQQTEGQDISRFTLIPVAGFLLSDAVQPGTF